MIYLNGEFLARGLARLSIDDRGFLFGDGVYEVIRAVDGRMVEPEAHMDRLAHGMSGLEMEANGLSSQRLIEIAGCLLRENGLQHDQATVYLQVTRGAAPRTHHYPPAGTPPTVLVSTASFSPAAALHRDGAACITYPDLRWSRCDLKTINLLPNVMAKQRASAAGVFEAVLIRDGVLTEGSHSNVFAVMDGVIRTHPLTNRVLPGITRRVLFRLAEEMGMEVREEAIQERELSGLDELFLTGTTTDVMPVTRLDGREVGDGRPGVMTQRLQSAYLEWMSGTSSSTLPACGPPSGSAPLVRADI